MNKHIRQSKRCIELKKKYIVDDKDIYKKLDDQYVLCKCL